MRTDYRGADEIRAREQQDAVWIGIAVRGVDSDRERDALRVHLA